MILNKSVVTSETCHVKKLENYRYKNLYFSNTQLRNVPLNKIEKGYICD